ncbi:MAG: hypothetical protein M3Q03_02685 [Chloroflexota bacterium]|nr:hypothetical protein [Chloroflexota bacterium]
MTIHYRLDPVWLAADGSPANDYLPDAAHILDLIEEGRNCDELFHLTHIALVDPFGDEMAGAGGEHFDEAAHTI